jgi:hypothetical protein
MDEHAALSVVLVPGIKSSDLIGSASIQSNPVIDVMGLTLGSPEQDITKHNRYISLRAW